MMHVVELVDVPFRSVARFEFTSRGDAEAFVAELEGVVERRAVAGYVEHSAYFDGHYIGTFETRQDAEAALAAFDPLSLIVTAP